MSKTYDVYIANNIFDITCANTPADRYHGPFLHIENMSGKSLACLTMIANAGEIAIAYSVNDDEEGETDG